MEGLLNSRAGLAKHSGPQTKSSLLAVFRRPGAKNDFYIFKGIRKKMKEEHFMINENYVKPNFCP